MKLLGTILFWLLLAGVAAAQSPPNGTPCNATGSGGAVTLCKPQWSYGCTAATTSTQILGTDGARTALLFQNTGANNIVLTFGDTATPGNGFVVNGGSTFLWSNLNNGNIPGRVVTSSISIISTSGAVPCVLLFAD